MAHAVKIKNIPYATKVGGEGKVYLTRVDVEDVGVVVRGPDKEGDLLVLFDDRVESISPKCLERIADPARVQLWTDCRWLEVGDEFEAVKLYLHHQKSLKALASTSGKTCSTCSETKPLGEFRNNVARRDGLHNQCRSCEMLYDDARQRSFQ